MCCLKNVAIFFLTILSFVLSRNILFTIYCNIYFRSYIINYIYFKYSWSSIITPRVGAHSQLPSFALASMKNNNHAIYYNHLSVHWAQGSRSANILLKNIALSGRTEFNFSKYNVLVCFNLMTNEKYKKYKNLCSNLVQWG